MREPPLSTGHRPLSTPPSLLAIDVGNSRIKLGLFHGDAPSSPPGALPDFSRTAAVAVDADVPWGEIRGWIGVSDAATGIVAGTNPAGVRKVLDGWPAGWRAARVLDDPREVPLQVDLPEPGKIGIDRLLNAVAANAIRPPDRPAIIVDTGTATTVDVLSTEGKFQGGAILPGFQLSARALHRYTALLPLIGIDELAHEPHPPLGQNTRAALRSGLFWGQLGAVKELIARLSVGEKEPALFLTGGGGPLLAPHLPHARHEPHLGLRGLALTARGRLDCDPPSGEC
ncbi:MAG: type III pantothenate kinase [Planctomycetales bacterium]